jgi:hypothetical protein
MKQINNIMDSGLKKSSNDLNKNKLEINNIERGVSTHPDSHFSQSRNDSENRGTRRASFDVDFKVKDLLSQSKQNVLDIEYGTDTKLSNISQTTENKNLDDKSNLVNEEKVAIEIYPEEEKDLFELLYNKNEENYENVDEKYCNENEIPTKKDKETEIWFNRTKFPSYQFSNSIWCSSCYVNYKNVCDDIFKELNIKNMDKLEDKIKESINKTFFGSNITNKESIKNINKIKNIIFKFLLCIKARYKHHKYCYRKDPKRSREISKTKVSDDGHDCFMRIMCNYMGQLYNHYSFLLKLHKSSFNETIKDMFKNKETFSWCNERKRSHDIRSRFKRKINKQFIEIFRSNRSGIYY